MNGLPALELKIEIIQTENYPAVLASGHLQDAGGREINLLQVGHSPLEGDFLDDDLVCDGKVLHDCVVIPRTRDPRPFGFDSTSWVIVGRLRNQHQARPKETLPDRIWPARGHRNRSMP